LKLDFERARVAGAVTVELSRNENPAHHGCPEFARGFPVCRATIAPPGRGYTDFLGWVQLVESTDLFGEFRIDPFEPLDTEPTHPFCFYGFAPTLFDAPHREHREDTGWVAQSFLCGLGAEPLRPPGEIDHILGFSWGFRIRGGEIEIEAAAPLPGSAWDRHLPYLRQAFPRWSFLPA
jgi:hypothetical protein